MARPHRPWFEKSKNRWVIDHNRKRVPLAAGPKNAETKKKAEAAFHRYMVTVAANPPVDGGNPTVASVIDAFLKHDAGRSSSRTYYERARYLQAFAEAHGFRLVRDALPYHLNSWLDAHPEWSRNPWTNSYVVRAVKRVFNWAVKDGLIPANPFRPVEHHAGSPRRPITDEEFTRLVEAAVRNKRMGRLVEVLRFMRWTGCRPGRSVRSAGSTLTPNGG